MDSRIAKGLVTVAVLAAGLAADADARAAKSYKNCTALNKDYAHGVGRPGARDHTSGRAVTTFRVSKRLYQHNDGKSPRYANEYDLDRDNDGIACEKL